MFSVMVGLTGGREGGLPPRPCPAAPPRLGDASLLVLLDRGIPDRFLLEGGRPTCTSRVL